MVRNAGKEERMAKSMERSKTLTGGNFIVYVVAFLIMVIAFQIKRIQREKERR